MVRMKNRWLLFEVIFEDDKILPLPKPEKGSTSGGKKNDKIDTDHFNDNDPSGNDAGFTIITSRQFSSSSTYLTTREINHALRDSVCHNFGDVGIGWVIGSLSVKYFSPFTNHGILRVSREYYHIVWGALSFINEVRGRSCLFRVIHLSGTIKKCQLAAIELDREQILTRRTMAESRGTLIRRVLLHRLIFD
ncbi:hypothetical protein G9A89_010674 [Geosiphon pyriformis]|nr:hypothetical protein G9A89_010674 [Geosiphon pyriformis]